MYHTQTWQECWDNSKQSTAEHTYPKRLLVRAGHTVLVRLMSANPHGYPVPGRDGRGRIVAPSSFDTETLETEATSQKSAETAIIPSAFHEALEQPQDLLSQPTTDTPKPEK